MVRSFFLMVCFLITIAVFFIVSAYGETLTSKYPSDSIHSTGGLNLTSFRKYHAVIDFLPPRQGIDKAIDSLTGDTYRLDPEDSDKELSPWREVVWQWESDVSLQKKRIEFEEKLARNNALAIFDEKRGRLLSLTIKGKLWTAYEGNADQFFEPARSEFFSADDEMLEQIVTLFPELRNLKIEDMETGITNEGIKCLSRLKYLNTLEILPISRHYCNVTNDAMPYIGQCKNLKSLKLSRMQITDSGIFQLAPLSGLRYLLLKDLFLSPRSFTAIAKLPNIHFVRITINNTLGKSYGKRTLDAIASLDGRLKRLYINEGYLTASGDLIGYSPDFFYAVSQIKSLKSLSFGRSSHNDLSVFFFNYDEKTDNLRPNTYQYIHESAITYESLIRDLKASYPKNNLGAVRDWSKYDDYKPASE